MEKVKLVVRHREADGSRGARRLRREGRIPGVLYGHGNPATLLSVEPGALRAALSTGAGTHAVLEIVFEDQKKVHRAIVKEMELDRVKHTVTHIDLEEVRLQAEKAAIIIKSTKQWITIFLFFIAVTPPYKLW